MDNRIYIAIDLKSFYASVECADRHLDPLDANLVVADQSRTEKTICLAVSPSLKSCGIPGRARLFEVIQKVRQINGIRLMHTPQRRFTGKSSSAAALRRTPSLELDYIIAQPRMSRYMDVSRQIYAIYLKHVAPEDIHVYSIDEVFIDATQYLRLYRLSPRDFAMRMIQDVLHATGITATAGIGTNLYLAKIAMDILAKHIPADRNGVRIAELDEISYRRQLWLHQPLTDFWRIGHGIAEKLETHGMRTMGDVARMSLQHEDALFRLFGVNAELVIDHAWGYEPCTIAAIKSYRPESNSLSVGQVLQNPYNYAQTRLVVKEMADSLVLDLVAKRLVTDQMELTLEYDVSNLQGTSPRYNGPLVTDHYGRLLPKDAHGTIRLNGQTSSSRHILSAVLELYERIINRALLVRKIYVVANHAINENDISGDNPPEQLDLFVDYKAEATRKRQEKAAAERERRTQEAVLAIRRNLGKNAILKGMNLEKGATARERNRQIGGHLA